MMAAAKKPIEKITVAEVVAELATTVDAPEVEQTIPEPIIEAEPVPARQQWEYARVRDGGVDGGDMLLSRLREAGTEGWEAISVDSYQGIAWLKRPVL